MCAETNTEGAVSPATVPPVAGREPAADKTTAIGRLRFDLLYSALYHDRQETRWQRRHRAALFISVLLGSGAVAAFGAQFPVWGQIAGVAIATISAAQLVWDFGGRARDHRDLKGRFYALLAKAQTADCDIAGLRGEAVALYADEPPIHNADRRAAHNQAGESLFGDDFDKV
jgi:hypothetical protein